MIAYSSILWNNWPQRKRGIGKITGELEPSSIGSQKPNVYLVVWNNSGMAIHKTEIGKC